VRGEGNGEWLAEQFETHRTHLRAVAYRMLGSPGDAGTSGVDDLVASMPGHATLAEVAARKAARYGRTGRGLSVSILT